MYLVFSCLPLLLLLLPPPPAQDPQTKLCLHARIVLALFLLRRAKVFSQLSWQESIKVHQREAAKPDERCDAWID